MQTLKPTIIHILWDGDFGGIQRIVKSVFLDNASSPFKHITIIAGHFGPLIGPAGDRHCLGMKNGFDFVAFLKLWKILKNFPDSILVYHLDTPIFRLFFPKNTPLIYLEHGCTAKRDKYISINKILGIRFFRHSGKIVCISKQIQEIFISFLPQYSSKTIVLNNPVTLPFSKHRTNPCNHPTIGFIGRFSPEKGPKEFIKCACCLSSKYPELRFRMVGDGPLLSECKDQAEQAGILVEFIGNSDDISRELESIDIVVVSSLKDAFNMVVVEAMARGVPVAAYPVGGIPEIITDNETGLLSEAVEPAALARSIERILFEEGLYKKLSANAFSHARERYGLHEYRKKWEDILSKVARPFAKEKT